MSQLLGINPHEKLETIIEEVLAEIGIKSYADLETGEINMTRLNQFFKLEDRLRQELYRKAKVYETQASKIRKENKMRPFSWALETHDRIRHYIRTEKWQLPALKNTEESDDGTNQPMRQNHGKAKRQIHKKSNPFNRTDSPKTGRRYMGATDRRTRRTLGKGDSKGHTLRCV